MKRRNLSPLLVTTEPQSRKVTGTRYDERVKVAAEIDAVVKNLTEVTLASPGALQPEAGFAFQVSKTA